MIMIHFRQHVHGIGVKIEIRVIDNSQSVKLVTESTLAEDELGRVRAVEAVDTICSTYAVLERNSVAPSSFGLPKKRLDGLQL